MASFFSKKTSHTHIATPFNALEPALQNIDSLFENASDVIQENRNTIKKLYLQNQCFAVKRFAIPRFPQSWIYASFRPSKAIRAFEYALKLGSLGISTPKPVGYIERFESCALRNSYFISEYFEYDCTMREILKTHTEENFHIAAEFAKFSFMLHSKGVLHLDFTSGNTLITHRNSNPSFTLVDINRMRFNETRLSNKLKSLSQTTRDPAFIAVIAKNYAQCAGIDAPLVEKKLTTYAKQHNQARQRKKRLKRFFAKLF